MDVPFADLPILAGVALALSLAAPPGPANALIAHHAVRRGFLAGWVTGLGALSGDVTMFLLMWAGIAAGLLDASWLQVGLGAAGALLMGWFALEAFRSARASAPATDLRGGFVRSYVTVVTSPFNWVWWATAGSTLLASLGLGMVFGFFLGILLWTLGWAWLAKEGAARLRGFAGFVSYGAALVLALFAFVLGYASLGRGARLLGWLPDGAG